MKKILILFVTVLLATGLFACTGGDKPTEKASEDFLYVYSADVQTFDYTITQNASDHEVNANLVDGLLENDVYGDYVGAIAETWSANEDSTVWTFNLRQGAKWVTATGEEYAEVTANDFVTGLRHAAEFNSETIAVVKSSIKNLAAYIAGTVAWEEVGIEASDDYTLVYTLEKPEPYFYTKTTYSILYPINQAFLESKGVGCQLGAADTTQCDFGNASSNDNILYNGGYIVASNVSKSEIKLTKNPSYWDAENVFIENVTWVYDDGSDPSSTVIGFEGSGYSQAVLLTSGDNFGTYMEKYETNAYTGLPNAYSFGINFNFNRKSFEFTEKTDKQIADTELALQNKNFRLAILLAFDRVTYLSQNLMPEIALAAIRNTWTPYTFLTVDGQPYGSVVEDKLAETDFPITDADLKEGVDTYYNVELAQQYMALAVEELTAQGVEFPIVLDHFAAEASKSQVAQAASLKQMLETNLAGFVEVRSWLHDTDTYYGMSYEAVDSYDCDWDINTSTGWGADYQDPKTYLNVFSIVDGDVLYSSMGLEYYGSDTAENDAAIENVGLLEYQALLEAADAIVDDNNARYEAYAKAEAYLISNALLVPVQTQSGAVNYRISRIEPFTKQYSQSGICGYKFKGMKIGTEIVDATDYYADRDNWLSHE